MYSRGQTDVSAKDELCPEEKLAGATPETPPRQGRDLFQRQPNLFWCAAQLQSSVTCILKYLAMVAQLVRVALTVRHLLLNVFFSFCVLNSCDSFS